MGFRDRTNSPELEDKLQRQLHVASFEVTAREDAAIGGNEARYRVAGSVGKAADVKRTGHDEQIRVVENIKRFQAKLHAVLLVEFHPLVKTKVRIPEAGTAKRVALRHCGRERSNYAVAGKRIDERIRRRQLELHRTLMPPAPAPARPAPQGKVKEPAPYDASFDDDKER